MQILSGDVVQHLREEFACLPFCHGQVVEQIVAAVARSCTGNLTVEVGDEAEGAAHQTDDVLRLEIAAEDEVVACQAAHRSPVDNAVLPFRVVAEVGSGQVLDGVDGSYVQHRFAVGFFHADIECGDGLAAHLVLAANIDATQQPFVVDGE